jgi:hypothetical protein
MTNLSTLSVHNPEQQTATEEPGEIQPQSARKYTGLHTDTGAAPPPTEKNRPQRKITNIPVITRTNITMTLH